MKLQQDGKFKIASVDWGEVGKYLAITCTKGELEALDLQSVIPTRFTERERKPGPAYWESDKVKVKS